MDLVCSTLLKIGFLFQLCSQKGYVCEGCHTSEVIYPFDIETTYQVAIVGIGEYHVSMS